MSDFVMNLAVIVLTLWVSFCSRSVLRYCQFSLKPTMHPTFVLGFAQFTDFPVKCECFIPPRVFPCQFSNIGMWNSRTNLSCTIQTAQVFYLQFYGFFVFSFLRYELNRTSREVKVCCVSLDGKDYLCSHLFLGRPLNENICFYFLISNSFPEVFLQADLFIYSFSSCKQNMFSFACCQHGQLDPGRY